MSSLFDDSPQPTNDANAARLRAAGWTQFGCRSDGKWLRKADGKVMSEVEALKAIDEERKSS